MLILSWQENPKSSKSLKLENLFASSKSLLLLVKKIHREWPLDTGGQTKPFKVASSTTSRHSIPHGVGIEHKFNGQWSQSCLVLCKKKDESRRQQTLYIYMLSLYWREWRWRPWWRLLILKSSWFVCLFSEWVYYKIQFCGLFWL